MELFTKAKTIKLRCHNDKYLVADDDKDTVRQSRNNSSQKSIWIIEQIEEKTNKIRLKSCHGNYLYASDLPFLLGMTGNKVFQKSSEKSSDWETHWEPIRDGFQVRLRSWCGTYLRANGGTPPWRNSITHDHPHTSATRKWILWDVQAVEISESESVSSLHSAYLSSFSSIVSDEFLISEPGSPMGTVSPAKYSRKSSTSPIHLSSRKQGSGMEFFSNAKAVRLKSHHGKYLFADEDEESVTQNRNGSSKNARWTVEFVSDPISEHIFRLKSCYGKYLTASNHPFLLGMTGRKVIQSSPARLDSSLDWEPVKERSRVRLKTRYGNFLRANGGLPPWRNSITHDVPHRTATQDWILWNVDIVEIQLHSTRILKPDSDSNSDFDRDSALELNSTSSSTVSFESARPEFNDSSALNSPPKSEGRIIYYHVGDEEGEDESSERHCFTFRGNGVEELTRKLEEETGIEGLIICTRSPLNGKLHPLRLQLPPNNATLNVVLVLKSSKLARDFEKQGLI